jgi:methionyl-tRNA formyltransferase
MTASPALRVVFAGTPEFAAHHLRALIAAKTNLVAVYSQPDRRAGRGKKLSASPVKQVAATAGLDIYQPFSLRDKDAQAELASLRPDLLVVVAYGLILPQAVLDTPSLGCINVHASLLPRWRGAAPIQRSIEAGDTLTGISIMQMEAGLDTGPIVATVECPIGGNTTAAELHDQLAELGAPLLLQVLEDLPAQLAAARPQHEATATYAAKLDKAEAQLDWHQTASTLQRQVMAFNSFPVAWSLLGSERVKIWRAHSCPGDGLPGEILGSNEAGLVVACGEQALCITTAQLAGGRAIPSTALLNSRREFFAAGRVLESRHV